MSEDKKRFRFFFETGPAGDEPIALFFFDNDLPLSEQEFAEKHPTLDLVAQLANLRSQVRPHRCPCHDRPLSLNVVGESDGCLLIEFNWCDEHWDRHVAERRKRDGLAPTSGPCVRASDLMAD